MIMGEKKSSYYYIGSGLKNNVNNYFILYLKIKKKNENIRYSGMK